MHDIDSGREEGGFEIRLIRPEEAAEAELSDGAAR